MRSSLSVVSRLLLRSVRVPLVLVAVGGLGLAPALSQGSPTCYGDAVTAAPVADSNSIDARQFHIDNARVPGSIRSVRQTVTAWQVTQGTWNGQTLDGLCLVLVQSAAESATEPKQTNCYLSHDATPAQREALLAAFLASQPQLLTAQDIDTMRIEAAVISLEIDGQIVTLHLGLIA